MISSKRNFFNPHNMNEERKYKVKIKEDIEGATKAIEKYGKK